MPSSRIEPKASASAVAQSMPSPDSIVCAAVVEEAADRLVDLEVLGDLGQLLADLLQRLHRHGRLAAALLVLVVGGAQARPGAVQPVGLVGLVVLADLQLGLEMGAPVGLHLVEVGRGDQALRRSACRHRSARVVLCERMLRYMIGCVNAGSSPSLWPKRR